MARKQILTNIEIEKDVVSSLENPPKESEASYKRWTIPCIILAILLVIIEFIYPIFILWFLLALIAFVIIYSIFDRFRLKNKIKSVTINDYEITTEIVHSTEEEHYRAETGGSIRHRRTEQINNYTIRFPGCQTEVPKSAYIFSVFCSCSVSFFVIMQNYRFSCRA